MRGGEAREGREVSAAATEVGGTTGAPCLAEARGMLDEEDADVAAS